MRTIDADALKKAIDEAYEEYDGYNPHDLSRFAERVDEIIDNAPNVEAFTKEDMAGAYNEGYACGSRENTRPQGEWYYNYLYGWHCSICNKSVKDMPTDNHKAVFNFCPNCGADMRGAE